MLEGWNNEAGMMEQWNDGKMFKKDGKEVHFAMSLNPIFQSSIIPIFPI
jgi:hypothetical protein